MRKLLYICTFVFLFNTSSLLAQMQVSGIPMTIAGGPNSYNAMVQQLFGTGVVVSNITLNCDTNQVQAGWFTANGTNLGLAQGMLLTSGDINGGPGPNSVANYTGNVQNGLGDADLNTQISGFTTNDACIIEFDVIPFCDTLSIKYVFGSDEYEEFVNSIFNDVFAFFVSGPNPAGGNYLSQNIALIPGTTTPVSINNVNCNANSAYYRCNSQNSTTFGGICTAANCPANNATTTLQYDGLTTVLDARAAVVPCQTYHVKIAVADGGGHLLDSGVFLQAGGVSCSTTLLSANTTTSAVEGCANGVFTFNLPAPLQTPDTFIFQVGGTATAGLDYPANAIPDTLIIPAGASSGSIVVPVFSDLLTDGGETIQLIYSDTALCGAQIITDTFTLYILDAPVTNAGPDKAICSGNTASIGVPAAFGHSYHWTPNTGITGGTDTLSTALVSLINNTGAPYTITYTFTDSAGNTGCVSSDVVNVTVNPAPIASFSAPNVCYGTNATFTNTSSPNVFASHWDFGDGTNNNQVTTTHLYTAAGTYNVQLITTSNAGCLDTIVQSITIYPKPNADFTANAVCYHLPTQFTDNSGTATQWNWNLGDGSLFYTQNVSYTYSAPGTYQTQLIITDAQGCKDSVSKPVQVYALPVANFSVQNACVYDNFAFQNQSQQGTNPLTNYAWNFGDTQTAAQVSPSHLYALAGNYTVTLMVADAFGCADTLQKNVSVYPKPTAQFSMSNICEGQLANFNNNSQVSIGNIVGNYWHFGDNTSSLNFAPKHLYPNAGVFSVTLEVQTEHNCVDSISHSISVFPKPTPNFSANTVCLGETTFFSDNSLISPIIQNDSIVTWNWNFGDNGSSMIQNPNHLYPQAGNYAVMLTATTDKGCKDSLLRSVIVNALPDTPIIRNDSVCFGNDALLFAASPDFVKIHWYHFTTDSLPFYTGTQYVLPNLTTNESYYVQAVGIGTGCKTAMFPIEAIVYPETNQSIQVSDSVVFIPNATITFSVTSDIEIINYEWDLGDHESSMESNPLHQYHYPKTYLVKVLTIDKNGCEKLLEKNITVKEVYGVHVPSAFSPNGDNSNDAFFVGTYEIANFHIDIYNRWGALIFSADNPDFRWDGKVDGGKDCPEGVYVYKVSAISTNNKSISKTGTITLIR